MILTALRLYAIHATTSALGDRIRPGNIDKGETLPAATMLVISSVNQDSLDGPTDHYNDRIQIDVYGTDAANAYSTAHVLMRHLATARGLIATETDGEPELEICGMQIASGVRTITPDNPIDGSDVWRHRAIFELFVSYNLPS